MSEENQGICRTLSVLENAKNATYFKLNTKLSSLKRLADLLEQSSDLASLIPNLANFVPLSHINLDVYNSMRRNCPNLGLPALSPFESLNSLRKSVEDAYQSILNKLNGHPWKRLEDLDRLLNDAIEGLNFQQPDWFACFRSICQTQNEFIQSSENLSKDIQNTPTNVSKVLNASQQSKVREINQTIEH